MNSGQWIYLPSKRTLENEPLNGSKDGRYSFSISPYRETEREREIDRNFFKCVR